MKTKLHPQRNFWFYWIPPGSSRFGFTMNDVVRQELTPKQAKISNSILSSLRLKSNSDVAEALKYSPWPSSTSPILLLLVIILEEC